MSGPEATPGVGIAGRDPEQLRQQLAHLDQLWEKTWSKEPDGAPNPETIAKLTRVMRAIFWLLPALGLFAIALPLMLGSPWYFGVPGAILFLVSAVLSVVLVRRLRTYQNILGNFEALRAALRARIDQLEQDGKQ